MISVHMSNPNNTGGYLIYTRRSTDDADSQKNSIDYQIKACRDYAAAHGIILSSLDVQGFCAEGVIVERHSAYKTSDISIRRDGSIAYRIERPKFQQLVELLVAGAAGGVICLCWDRLTRNPQDGIIIKKLIARRRDIRFVQATYDASSSGALHMDIDDMFAAHYSRVISEKVRAAYEKLHAEGKCTYFAPIGYLDGGSDNKPLDPERAPIVKHLFEHYATGAWSINQLACWANQQGLTTKPTRRRRTTQQILDGEENGNPTVCHPITRTTVEIILKNPFYAGWLRVGNELVEGIHQPLVTRRLFDRVQRMLRTRCVTAQYVDDRPFFTYRGILRCDCGRTYSPYRQKTTNYYRVPCLPGCPNSAPNISESLVDAAVVTVLNGVSFSDAERDCIDAATPRLLDYARGQRQRKREGLERERKRVLQDLRYLTDEKLNLLRSGAYSAEEYRGAEIRLTERLAELDAQLMGTGPDESEMLQHVLKFSELLKLAGLCYNLALDTEKRQICLAAFSELRVVGKNVSTKAKEGCETLFGRHGVQSGAADFLFSDLHGIYSSVKRSAPQFEAMTFLKSTDREII